MPTIVLATQKGGSGKTNIARSMAVEAARGGAKVGPFGSRSAGKFDALVEAS